MHINLILILIYLWYLLNLWHLVVIFFHFILAIIFISNSAWFADNFIIITAQLIVGQGLPPWFFCSVTLIHCSWVNGIFWVIVFYLMYLYILDIMNKVLLQGLIISSPLSMSSSMVPRLARAVTWPVPAPVAQGHHRPSNTATCPSRGLYDPEMMAME